LATDQMRTFEFTIRDKDGNTRVQTVEVEYPGCEGPNGIVITEPIALGLKIGDVVIRTRMVHQDDNNVYQEVEAKAKRTLERYKEAEAKSKEELARYLQSRDYRRAQALDEELHRRAEQEK
jgi:hypothetical protein